MKRLMNRITALLCLGILAVRISCEAALVVNVQEPKVTGQKAVVALDLKNTFTEGIQSVRANVFLLDDKGKTVGQMTKWIMGGKKRRSGLSSGDETMYYCVITSLRPLGAAKLKAKVQISRVILAGGKPADVINDVIVKEAENK
jgi:hypothetical protein